MKIVLPLWYEMQYFYFVNFFNYSMYLYYVCSSYISEECFKQIVCRTYSVGTTRNNHEPLTTILAIPEVGILKICRWLGVRTTTTPLDARAHFPVYRQ